MANKVLIKKKTDGAGAPGEGDVDAGELAINTVSGRLYFKDSSNNIKYYADSTAAATTDDATALAIALG
jgi:hypothetical protein